MGCDIHMALERKYKGCWIGIDAFRGHAMRFPRENKFDRSYPAATGRNYALFAKLAGVRGEGPEPRGLPDDASELTRAETEAWDGDGHSHSWLPLSEALTAYLATIDDPVQLLTDNDHRVKYPAYYWFGVDCERNDPEIDDYRIVFWFDN